VPIGWPGEVCDFRGPLDYLGGEGGGGLGASLGIAVGAALALRASGRLPIAIVGDGDFLMGNSALWTVAHYQIPLLIIVANNRSYGNSERHQERIAKQRSRLVVNKWIGTRIESPTADIAGIARAQGLHGGGPIRDMEELGEALEKGIQAVDRGQSYVLDIVFK
jgi:thiamine pyrophosphate-dependent acetolactate synthase large subunit-like protein